MRQTENLHASAKPKKGLGKRLLNLSHDLAHGFGEKIVQPAINISQYQTFENPKKHKKQINRQMHRIFQRAESSVKGDNLLSKLIFAQLILAVGLGEHVPIPLSWIPFIPPEFHNIPLPFDVHVNIPFPPGEILNHIPNVHLPTEFAVNGPYWPLLSSGIIMSTAVNGVNTWRAYKEKRPGKIAWYGPSMIGAFTYVVPIAFNSFWWELGIRPAERKAGQVFAEKVSHVLEGKPVIHKPEVETKDEVARRRFFDKIPGVKGIKKTIGAIPAVKRLKTMTTGDIHIHPKDREVFVEAIEKRITAKRPREWWIQRLQEVETDAKTSVKFGLPHEQEKIAYHEDLEAKRKFFGSKWWHKAWTGYHKHMQERIEEKIEAIQTAQDFMKLSESKAVA